MAADPTKAADDTILAEIRERFSYAMDQWRDTRAAAKEDMRVVGGDPWQPKDRKAREDAGRVCLSLDELHQYFNQTINEVRASPRAPKFDPTGNGANDQTARFYGDKMREIEYRSQAQIAYTTAFQNAVHQGYGWVRLYTKFVPKSFVQDLWIDEIPNPDLIVGDPDALRPTSSDQKYLFELHSLSVREFKREFPDAQVTSFTPEIISQAPAWISQERVQVANYWMVEPSTKTLVQLRAPNGTVGELYEDEIEAMPPGAVVLNRRPDDMPQVCMYLTNGVELLTKPGQTDKKVKWAGKSIPFVSCFGMMIYVDEGSGPKRKILSMTRLARDPYMLYCYYRTCQAELVGMTPKIPYFVRRGSLKPDQLTNLQKSLHEPVAVIEVEAIVEGMPQPPEFPQRNPFSPEIQILEIGAEGARRAIQAAMGISPLPTQAQRHNDKSGIALRQIESSQQKGSYHFIDHYEAMLQEVGVKTEDLIDKVYDTARDVGVRNARGEAKSMRINDPSVPAPKGLPSVKGDHTVTISTGPAFESQRQEGSAFLDSLVANLQMIAATAGPKQAAALFGLAIKLKNLGELGDEMSKIVTPAEFQAKDGEPPDPMMLQAHGQIQQLQQALQTVTQKLESKEIERQTELQKAQLDNDTRVKIAEINQAGAFAVADLKATVDAATNAITAMQQERLAMQASSEETRRMIHDALQAHADRGHELGMAVVDHQHALEQQQAAPAPDTMTQS